MSHQDKKAYLLQKYSKRDYTIEDLEACKKFGLFWQPQTQATNTWACNC